MHDRTKSPLAVKSHIRQYLNHNGDVIYKEDTTQEMTSWDLLYNVPRRNYVALGRMRISEMRKSRGQMM